MSPLLFLFRLSLQVIIRLSDHGRGTSLPSGARKAASHPMSFPFTVFPLVCIRLLCVLHNLHNYCSDNTIHTIHSVLNTYVMILGGDRHCLPSKASLQLGFLGGRIPKGQLNLG